MKLRSNSDIQVSVRVDFVNSIYDNKVALEAYIHHLVAFSLYVLEIKVFLHHLTISPVNICLFKVNNRNIRKRSQICSKLTIKALTTLGEKITSSNLLFLLFWLFLLNACCNACFYLPSIYSISIYFLSYEIG